MVNVGEIAPNSTVKKTTIGEVNSNFTLKEAYDNDSASIFYFFPAAFTGVCTKSSCELRDDIEEFSKLNAEIYGISVDMPFTQKVFIEKNDINYPLLSDWNKEMINAFDIVDDNFAGSLKGVAKRSLFAIKNNKIIYRWIAEHPGKYPPFDELKEILLE